jgi:drug/metabolite transporter (DMT)-like permease
VVATVLGGTGLGRQFPSKRNLVSRALIVVGACCYASFNFDFQTRGGDVAAYGWPTAYLIIVSLEMAFGRRIIESVDLQTPTGSILYTSLLGLPPMALFAVMGHETDRLFGAGLAFSAAGLAFLLLGCIVATGIGYSAAWCRAKVPAERVTLVGLTNQVLAVLINTAVWGPNAPVGRIVSLFLCLVGCAMFQHACPGDDAVASEGKKFDGLGAEVPSGECESLLDSEHETAAAKCAYVPDRL